MAARPEPSATVIVPTRGRPGYLARTLDTIVPQARAAGAEVLVVLDGSDEQSAAVATAQGARVIELPEPRGANAARNAAVAGSHTELLILVDDDVAAPPGWLEAMLRGAERHPDHEVLGGPIRGRLEGFALPVCGRESPPLTTLERGPLDRDVPFVWSANMAIRRSALRRVGLFDERIAIRGDEEDWQRRYRTAGGRIRYLAAAGLAHRRSPEDSRLLALARAAHGHGRAARAYDRHKGTAPSLLAELRALAGSGWHLARRRCAYAIPMAAHALGRLQEAAWG